MISLLVYFRDNKVTGTPSTGNLPLKAVREVCASFVHPPPLETSIGEIIYTVRSELEVWSLFFLHILASVVGLATGGMGKPWKLTPLGEHFLTEAAPKQVGYLLTVWWTQVNWASSFSYGIPGGQMPPGFERIVLKHLLALPAGEQNSFFDFADQLIEEEKLTWQAENPDYSKIILRSVLHQSVIDALSDFGMLRQEYGPPKFSDLEFGDLIAFQVTPFGEGLLKALQDANWQNQA